MTDDPDPFGPGTETPTPRRLTNVDATAHYRQQAKRLAREKAFYVGALVGGVVVFIALFAWEVLQA